MICPKCKTETLKDFGQMEGVDIDFCGTCKGIWFDAGELAFYVEASEDVPGLDKALQTGRDSGCLCPRCKTQHLVETQYLPGETLLIDICPACHGIFLDRGELPKVELLQASFGGLNKVLRTAVALEKRGFVILGSGPNRR